MLFIVLFICSNYAKKYAFDLLNYSKAYALHQESIICYVPQHSRLEQVPVFAEIRIGIQTTLYYPGQKKLKQPRARGTGA